MIKLEFSVDNGEEVTPISIAAALISHDLNLSDCELDEIADHLKAYTHRRWEEELKEARDND